jgi:hypothetical protein
MKSSNTSRQEVDRNAPLPTGESVEKLGELHLPFEIRSEGSGGEKEKNRKRA